MHRLLNDIVYGSVTISIVSVVVISDRMLVFLTVNRACPVDHTLPVSPVLSCDYGLVET